MAFVFVPRSREQIEKRATQQGGDFKGFIIDEVKTFSPKDGDNLIRILPPTWDDPSHFGIDIWVHYGIGPENASVLCLSKMKGEDCPICNERARLDRLGDEEGAKELKPTRRVLVWMLDMNDQNASPIAWAMPWTFDRDLNKICLDEDGSAVCIDDPKNGYNVSFATEGKGQQKKYVGTRLARKPSAVPADALNFVVDVQLPNILLWRSASEVEELFKGKPKEKEEADEAPRGKLQRRMVKESSQSKEGDGPPFDTDDPGLQLDDIPFQEEPVVDLEPAEQPVKMMPRAQTSKPAPAAPTPAPAAPLSKADALRARFAAKR